MLTLNGYQKGIIILGLLSIVVLGFVAIYHCGDPGLNWSALMLGYFLISIITGIVAYVFQIQLSKKRLLTRLRVLSFLAFVVSLFFIIYAVASELAPISVTRGCSYQFYRTFSTANRPDTTTQFSVSISA